jgi:hypothetical protein
MLLLSPAFCIGGVNVLPCAGSEDGAIPACISCIALSLCPLLADGAMPPEPELKGKKETSDSKNGIRKNYNKYQLSE